MSKEPPAILKVVTCVKTFQDGSEHVCLCGVFEEDKVPQDKIESLRKQGIPFNVTSCFFNVNMNNLPIFNIGIPVLP